MGRGDYIKLTHRRPSLLVIAVFCFDLLDMQVAQDGRHWGQFVGFAMKHFTRAVLDIFPGCAPMP